MQKCINKSNLQAIFYESYKLQEKNVNFNWSLFYSADINENEIETGFNIVTIKILKQIQPIADI